MHIEHATRSLQGSMRSCSSAAAAPKGAAHCQLAVTMPTRNQAAYLAGAVESVFEQGIPGLQLFVQDGASTDGTPALLAELAQRHAGLQWVSAPDAGPADALNRAFARALAQTDAPVLGWLNSDDLYTPGAATRALAHLRGHPTHVAVYGEGEHIDAQARPLGRYPSARPEAPLAQWRDACLVCQPTMFLRRETLQALGPLDTTLRTAFDYDLWLRLFTRFAGRIGFVPTVQARSRLHAAGITLRQREQVALEGLQVVHRHLGPAPVHWLVTHVAEALAACPFEADTAQVQAHLLALAERAAPWLAAGDVAALQQQLRASRAWQLARPHFAAGVHADGWAGPVLELRLLQPADAAQTVAALRVHGRHAWPRPGCLRLGLEAWHDGRRVAACHAWWRQGFALDVPVAQRTPGARLRLELRASHSFVPGEVLAGSGDMRRLAFVVHDLEMLPVP